MSITDHITIEPLAFMAIMALFIEFPSIQDLIYTKICLQVVTNNPAIANVTPAAHHRLPINNMTQVKNLNSDLEISSINKASRWIEMQIPSEANSSSLPPPGGRIGRETESTIYNPSFLSHDHFLCDRLNKSLIPLEIRQQITAQDSLFWLKYQLIICFLCALSSPYWGGMSDKIGRLIPINMPIGAAVICNIISLLFGILISLDSHHLFNIEWLYLGAVLVGLSGGQAIIIVNAFSFISDNSTSESRSKRITILETIIYLSHGAGFYVNKHVMKLGLAPVQQAWLNRHFVAFSLCILLNLACILYTLLKLRHHKFHRFLNNFEREQQEAAAGDGSAIGSCSTVVGSLSRIDSSGVSPLGYRVSNPDRQRELTSTTPDDLDGPIARADKRFTNWGAVLTLKYYKQTYTTITKPRESRAIIWALLLCGFISALSLASLLSLLYIYLRMDPFNWTTSQYSSWNSINSVGKGVALIVLTMSMKFVKGWSVPDPLVATVGYLSKGVGLFMIGLATTSSVISWVPLALIFSEFSMPPIRSLLSKLVVHEEVAKVYSCLAAIQNSCFLMGNIVFYLAYNSLDIQDFFRTCFLVVGGLEFVALLIMLSIYHQLRKRVIVL